MKIAEKFFSIKVFVVFILFQIAFVHTYGQISYFGSELNLLKLKSDDLKFWDIYVNGEAKISIMDEWILKRTDKKFRLGDLFGIKGGMGIGRVSYYFSDANKKFNIGADLGYSIGGFVGYNNSKIGLFYKYQYEVNRCYQVVSYTIFGTRTKVNSIALLLNDLYMFELSIGNPVDPTQDVDLDKMIRFGFKYYYEERDDGDKDYMGLTFESINKDGLQRFNTFSFTGGYTF